MVKFSVVFVGNVVVVGTELGFEIVEVVKIFKVLIVIKIVVFI